jgi:hypothetical protein
MVRIRCESYKYAIKLCNATFDQQSIFELYEQFYILLRHLKKIAENAETLADTGITAVWFPPAYKGAEGGDAVGYSVYDLFNLWKFDQKRGKEGEEFGMAGLMSNGDEKQAPLEQKILILPIR